jgi:hypothetical protein
MPDLTFAHDGSASLTDARLSVALEALSEADALHGLLASLLYPLHDLSAEADRLRVRQQAECQLRRLAELNAIVSDALQAEEHGAAALAQRLQGPLPRQGRAHG